MPKKSSVPPPKTFWTKNSRGEEVSISLPSPPKITKGSKFCSLQKNTLLVRFLTKIVWRIFLQKEKFWPFQTCKRNIFSCFFQRIYCWKNFTDNFFGQTYKLRGQKGRKIIKIFWGDFLLPNFIFIALKTFGHCLNQKRGRICKKSYKMIPLKVLVTF